jgi:LemA protein
MTAFYVLLGLVVLSALIVISKYNGIIRLKNIREQSFADIDVQLKLRFDLVPNLVNTVKGYMTHERETFEAVTKARTSFLNAWNNIDWKMEADNMLAWALKSIFAVAENYPDLKANTNFNQLQSELSDIENKIAASRRFFNSSTQEYNTFIEIFPNNIIAWMFNFRTEKLYEIVDVVERENVKVNF